MSTDNAAGYADQIANDIRKATDAGAPFGWVNPETDEHFDARKDAPKGERKTLVEASGMDYLRDILDIQYVVSSDRTYRSARVLIAFGGPNAWIDTRTEQLEVSWWSAPEYRDLPSDFIRGLDDALEELWEMDA